MTTGYDLAFAVQGTDPTALSPFESEPFLTFSVPPSSNRHALFFEMWAYALFAWTDLPVRDIECRVRSRIMSDLIPEEIEVHTWMTVVRIAEQNPAGGYDTALRRAGRTWKLPLRRGQSDFWYVEHKDEPPPTLP